MEKKTKCHKEKTIQKDQIKHTVGAKDWLDILIQNIVINIINMLSKENHRNIQTNEEKVKPLKN